MCSRLLFNDASFNVIVLRGALRHISRERSDHKKAINEMLRVLKPGGRIDLWDISRMVESYTANIQTKGVSSNVKRTTQSPFWFEVSVMRQEKCLQGCIPTRDAPTRLVGNRTSRVRRLPGIS